MDFRSLTRKELQALCKNNKIPANITNVAMADALTSLDIVEGLEEMLKQSQLPEKEIPESPSIPRTATRTATRIKPIKEEPETAQPTCVNLFQTPEASANRRQAPSTSARSVQQGAYSTRRSARLLEKTMKELSLKETVMPEPKVLQQGVYSTRRSARLLEKTMKELSLKERVPEPVKMDDFNETEERDVSGNLERTKDLSSGESLIEAPECERELQDDAQEKDNCADDDETSEESDEMGTVDVPVTELTSEIENPSTDVYDEIPTKDNKASESGTVDVPVTELTSEIENPSTDVYDEIPAKDNKANESGDVQVSLSETAKQIRSAIKCIELCLLNGRAKERSTAQNMDGHDSEDLKQGDKTVFVLNHLQQMQNRFQTMSDSIVPKIDEMGGLINELEQSANDLRDEFAQME